MNRYNQTAPRARAVNALVLPSLLAACFSFITCFDNVNGAKKNLVFMSALQTAAIWTIPPGNVWPAAGQMTADHTTARLYVLNAIPAAAITQAKANLHIAYGHTSHGSQLVTGMDGLYEWRGATYAFNEGGSNGALDLREPLPGAYDLGNPDRTNWATATRAYLAAHPDINVIIWSWCGQVSGASEAEINTYLNLMNQLEIDYPNVRFVYMTGHLDGGGLTGDLHRNNEQIRSFCRTNNKMLYDFADIESFTPDNVDLRSMNPHDTCIYDRNGLADSGNWATEWQGAHIRGVDWFDCSAAHSEPLNGNLKAYAAWWLWARIAGWDGQF